MEPSGPVHFIHLGGPFLWQHARAIATAAVHGVPVILWRADDTDGWMWESSRRGCPTDEVELLDLLVEVRPLDLPDWLRDHPIQLANVKDLYAWQILRDHGGLYLDLDTISLAPVWDLLTRDVLVSREWPNPGDGVHQFNSAAVAARAASPTLSDLYVRALRILEGGEAEWGKTGPHLLTDVVADHPDAFDVADFGVLSGWRDDTVEADYYDRLPNPLVPENARVLHLYSSSRPDKFAADRWWPDL